MRKIVVGVDGSSNADEALVWAMKEARDRRCEVEAMMAWHEPTDVAAMGTIGIDLSDLEQKSRDVLDQHVDAARHRNRSWWADGVTTPRCGSSSDR